MNFKRGGAVSGDEEEEGVEEVNERIVIRVVSKP